MIKLETKIIKDKENDFVGIGIETDKDDITEYVAILLRMAQTLNQKYNKTKEDIKDIIEKFV